MAVSGVGQSQDWHYNKQTLLQEHEVLYNKLHGKPSTISSTFTFLLDTPKDDLVPLRKQTLYELNQYQAIKIFELLPGVANPKKIIYSTIISDIASAEAIYFIIEDEFENACRVSVPLVVSKSQFDLGINLVILNPFYLMASDGKYTLIINDHSNLSLLNLKMPSKPSEPVYIFEKSSEMKNTDSHKEPRKKSKGKLQRAEAANISKDTNIVQKNVSNSPQKSSPLKIFDPKLKLSTPIHCDSSTEAGNKLFKECRYVQAIVQYAYAIQDTPYDAELYARRGLAYVNLACYEDALLDFERAKSLQPDIVRYQYLAAKAYSQIGNHPLSLELLKKIKPKENVDFLSVKKLLPSVEIYIQNIKGNFNFDLLKECFNEGRATEFGDYVGPIKIQASVKHGRGMFTTRNVKKGEDICVSKAIASSFGMLIHCPCPNCRSVNLGNDKINNALYYVLIENLRRSKVQTICFFLTFDISQQDVDIDLFSYSGYEISKTIDTSRYPLGKLSDLVQNIYLYHEHYYRLDKLMANNLIDSFHRIWLLPSLINHSCVPNAVRLYIGDICIVRAISDIPKGSEVFVSYLPLALIPDVQIRSQFLRFKCDCNLCVFERRYEHKEEIQQLIQLHNELVLSYPVQCVSSLFIQKEEIKKEKMDREKWLFLKEKAFRLVKLLPLSTTNEKVVSVSFQSIIICLIYQSSSPIDSINLALEAEPYFSELDPETYVTLWTWCNQASRAHLDPDGAQFKLIQKKFNEARKLFF